MSGKTSGLRPGVCALLFATLCLLCTPLSAAACGGMFSADAYTQQSAERLIFAVNPGQVTLYEQIRYTGSPRDFAWVLPVPSLPTVGTAPLALFQDLDQQTAPRFLLPATPSCDASVGSGAGAPSSGSVNVYGSGTAGPYTYQVIGSSNPQAPGQWLTAHHYNVPAESRAEMQPYIDAHMLFLTMRLRGDAGIQDMTPVKITYASSGPAITIPLRMATPMGQEPLGVQVWIFAAGRYTPENYQDLHPDYRLLTTTAYSALIKEAVGRAGGHGFVTEYARPTSTLFASEQTLVTLKQNYSYLTRLYTNLSPDWITLDPSFVAQTGLPDVSPIHQVGTPDPAPLCPPSLLVIAGGLAGGAAVVVLGVILWRTTSRRRRAG